MEVPETDYLTQREQYLNSTTLRRLKIPLQSFRSNAAPSPWSEAWARKLSSDKWQSTFFHEYEILLWFPIWAVLCSLANARKCQLVDFCEKNWETLAFYSRNMGAHVRSTCAKKVVSSNLAKTLKVAAEIWETCEKTLFTPSSPVKATKLYRFCLSDKRSPNRQSIFSDSTKCSRTLSDCSSPSRQHI